MSDYRTPERAIDIVNQHNDELVGRFVEKLSGGSAEIYDPTEAMAVVAASGLRERIIQLSSERLDFPTTVTGNRRDGYIVRAHTPLLCQGLRVSEQDNLGVVHSVTRGWVFEARAVARPKFLKHNPNKFKDFRQVSEELMIYDTEALEGGTQSRRQAFAVRLDSPFDYSAMETQKKMWAELTLISVLELPFMFEEMDEEKFDMDYEAAVHAAEEKSGIKQVIDPRLVDNSRLVSYSEDKVDDYFRMLGKQTPHVVLGLVNRALSELGE